MPRQHRDILEGHCLAELNGGGAWGGCHLLPRDGGCEDCYPKQGWEEEEAAPALTDVSTASLTHPGSGI